MSLTLGFETSRWVYAMFSIAYGSFMVKVNETPWAMMKKIKIH
jgi:hypothetical protein